MSTPEFFTILTSAGQAKIAAALANNAPLGITSMAVGSGEANNYYTPVATQAALKFEQWRGPLNSLTVNSQNANWLEAECVLPNDVGGFTIREIGLFDADGTLIAVGKYPATDKVAATSGAVVQIVVRAIFKVSNTSAVTLQVDPNTVLATRAYVDEQCETLGGAQTALAATQVQTLHRQMVHDGQLDDQSNALNQTSQSLAALTDEHAQTRARQSVDARRFDDRHQAVNRALDALAAVQIAAMTRQLEHEYRLPPNP